jgi:hypothetical protein
MKKQNLGKVVGGILFIALLFLNFKISFSPNLELTSNDIFAAYQWGEYHQTYNCIHTDLGWLCEFECLVGDEPECTKSGWGYVNN